MPQTDTTQECERLRALIDIQAMSGKALKEAIRQASGEPTPNVFLLLMLAYEAGWRRLPRRDVMERAE